MIYFGCTNAGPCKNFESLATWLVQTVSEIFRSCRRRRKESIRFCVGKTTFSFSWVFICTSFNDFDFPGTLQENWREDFLLDKVSRSWNLFSWKFYFLKYWRGLRPTTGALKSHHNRPFSNSHGRTGSSMKWRLTRTNLFKCKLFARISLHFMLDPVQPLEYETGLFSVE